jgi:heat-inducible transcriptional repressor
MELNKRDLQVLEAVVIDYLQSGEPVGSRTISKVYGLKVSPATIRNVMADLEEEDFLYQPHTSAGRVPTEKGLRFYLDRIMRFRELETHESAAIREAFKNPESDIKELLHLTSRVLSRFCKQAGVVLWPRLSMSRMKHIELVRLRPNRIMVIFISKSGLVHHRLLDWEEDVSQDELDKHGRYLNDILQDIPLGEVKQRILEEMQKEKVLFDELYTRALEISKQFFQFSLDSIEVYIDGQTNLLNNPEFADVERMRRLLGAFEDKSRIVKLLDRTLQTSSGVQIILGPESELEDLSEISLISSPYRRGSTLLGVLGVIGPVRMDYSRIIPVVEFTANLLSELMDLPDDA